jgi:hypothetical protein
MQRVVLRLLALGLLVGLYHLEPLAGIAALAAGFGYVAGEYRACRRVAAVNWATPTGSRF